LLSLKEERMEEIAVRPLHIGSLTISVPLVLAPMAGYTDSPFRALCRAHGCGLVFTELVSAEGIVFRNPRTMNYLHSIPEERPLAAHIYGASPEILTCAAQTVESLNRFDLIDINCGCPVPKIMKKGAGAALMEDPDKLYRIVKAVSEAVSLPVTVKTRLGISPERANISEVAEASKEGGASALFLHARFASAGHSGPADWDSLQKIAQEQSIPVVGNGGVMSGRDALDMLQRTDLSGVMIGRGAIGNPWIFEEAQHLLTGKSYTPPTAEERRETIATHLHSLYVLMDEENARRKRPRPFTERATCHRFRGHLVKYLTGVQEERALKRHLMELETIRDVLGAVDEILLSLQ
jgi:tRNA-dihydrouridine synthase B